MAAEVAHHPQAREVIWVQEEPDTMGALSFVVSRLRRLFPERKVLSIKRSAEASPAPAQPKHARWNKRHLLASRSVTKANEERDNLLTFARFFSL